MTTVIRDALKGPHEPVFVWTRYSYYYYLGRGYSSDLE